MIFRHIIFLLVFSLISHTSQAKSDSLSLKISISKLNEYLLKKDTIQLKQIITTTLTYGHSNGWIQNSQTLLSDLYNGKLSYTTINQESPNIAFENNIASVRANAVVEGLVDGNPFAMKLHILQVWLDTGKQGWKLMARQSAKIL